MGELSPEDRAIYRPASAALDELLRRWRELRVPFEGQAGMLLAAFVSVSVKERAMSMDEVVQDVIDCFESMLVPKGIGDA